MVLAGLGWLGSGAGLSGELCFFAGRHSGRLWLRPLDRKGCKVRCLLASL